MDNQIYISQLRTSLCFYKLLLEVKKIDVRLNKRSLYWCFLIVSIRHVLPTPWLIKQLTPPPFPLPPPLPPQTVLGLILLLFCMASKTWLKNAFHYTFEIGYSPEFVSTNARFLSRPSDTKIQTAIISAIIWW